MSSAASLADPEKSPASSYPGRRTPRDVKRVALSEVDVDAVFVVGRNLDAVDEAEAKRVL